MFPTIFSPSLLKPPVLISLLDEGATDRTLFEAALLGALLGGAAPFDGVLLALDFGGAVGKPSVLVNLFDLVSKTVFFKGSSLANDESLSNSFLLNSALFPLFLRFR